MGYAGSDPGLFSCAFLNRFWDWYRFAWQGSRYYIYTCMLGVYIRGINTRIQNFPYKFVELSWNCH